MAILSKVTVLCSGSCVLVVPGVCARLGRFNKAEIGVPIRDSWWMMLIAKLEGNELVAAGGFRVFWIDHGGVNVPGGLW